MVDREVQPFGEQPVRPHGVDEINSGSTYDWFMYATGIMMGKYTPHGFDEASRMMGEDPGKVRPVHHFWRMVESHVEGRLGEVLADPDSVFLANMIVDTMVNRHDALIDVMMAQLRALPNVSEPMESPAGSGDGSLRLGEILGLPPSPE